MGKMEEFLTSQLILQDVYCLFRFGILGAVKLSNAENVERPFPSRSLR